MHEKGDQEVQEFGVSPLGFVDHLHGTNLAFYGTDGNCGNRWISRLVLSTQVGGGVCSKRENRSESKIDHLKCVINAQPLLLEKCVSETDSISACYTVEFANTATILYGCTVLSQQKTSTASINCHNNMFNKCPVTLNKSRFSPYRHLQYCCCNTTKCNGNYLRRREAKVLPKGTDKNRSDAEMPELKRAALDINIPQRMSSGGDSVVTSKVSKTSWGLISGVICAAVVVACLIGAVIILINKRRQKHRAV
ncbi:hypothetical protein WUBG_01620 [Wuchereria bancrofti]|uniref:Uncharacterized protein n=1 Tax=Wuchereria bancrofti TaxID=6293 RepID=J9FJE7_WUCBA|nr:hypothetical protein WUBG_01620 [Wuchereria bancrofti]